MREQALCSKIANFYAQGPLRSSSTNSLNQQRRRSYALARGTMRRSGVRSSNASANAWKRAHRWRFACVSAKIRRRISSTCMKTSTITFRAMILKSVNRSIYLKVIEDAPVVEVGMCEDAVYAACSGRQMLDRRLGHVHPSKSPLNSNKFCLADDAP